MAGHAQFMLHKYYSIIIRFILSRTGKLLMLDNLEFTSARLIRIHIGQQIMIRQLQVAYRAQAVKKSVRRAVNYFFIESHIG